MVGIRSTISPSETKLSHKLKMPEKAVKGPKLSMKEVFVDCGSSLQSHGKLLKELKKLYDVTEFEEFWTEFVRLLKYPMVVYAREPVVERTIEFVAKFVGSVSVVSDTEEREEEDNNPLLTRLITFLLQSHSACSQSVRFRSCQLINKLLNNLGEEAHIDDDLYQGIFTGMLERVRDKLPLVRVQAVQALSRLQDPSDKDCPVVKAYMFLINCDPSPDVRKTVLNCIAPSTRTLAAILERTRDVKDVVRKTAYQVISEKVHIKALSIAQRIQLLQDGLNDRAEAVVKTCSNKLLQGWLQASAGNVLELLKNLDVESSVETCEQALSTMFKASAVGELVANFDLLNEKMLMEQEKLTGESSMYWSSLCKYIHSLGDSQEQFLEMVLPTCVDFTLYIQQYLDKCRQCNDLYEQLENEFILQQLLTMTSFMDLSDQASRKALQKLLDDILLDDTINHRLIKHIMPRLLDLYSDPESLVNHLAETISDIREPISTVEKNPSEDERRQNDLKLARIRVDLNQLREDMDEAIHQQDFVKAAEIKQQVSALEVEKAEIAESLVPHVEEIRTEKTDPETLLKCLSIVCEFMEKSPLKSLSPVIQMIIESLILPCVQKEDPDVRNLALKSLGLCCLLKKDTALQNLVLFVQASQVDTEGVRATALSILFDLLHQYGLDVLQVDTATHEENQNTTAVENNSLDTTTTVPESTEEDGKTSHKNTASNLLTILSSALDIESSELRTVAAEGLAKLLLSGRVMSAKLLSHLLLLWYNPVTEDDTHLRHCLGTFFPVFAVAGRCNQEVLEEAFMPTMRTLFNAPSSSPLADVDANNVADLLVQLTSAQLLLQNHNIKREQIKDHVIHDNLAFEICNEVLSHPDSFSVRVLVKTLNHLDIGSDDISRLKDLVTLSEQMLEAVKEKTCVKGLQKFECTLTQMVDKLKEREITSPVPQDSVSEEVVNDENIKPEEADVNSVTLQLNQLDTADTQNEQGETTIDTTKPIAAAKTPAKSVKKSKPRASAKTPSAANQMSDLENSVFLSPTPIRKSSAKNKTGNSVSSDVLEDSKLKVSSASRKSSRRVLLDVDNTSLQHPPE